MLLVRGEKKRLATNDDQLVFSRVEPPSCISHTLSYRPIPVSYDRIDLPDTQFFAALSDFEIRVRTAKGLEETSNVIVLMNMPTG